MDWFIRIKSNSCLAYRHRGKIGDCFIFFLAQYLERGASCSRSLIVIVMAWIMENFIMLLKLCKKYIPIICIGILITHGDA